MEAVIQGDDFDLRDPKDNTVKETVNARKLWERILKQGSENAGEPYLEASLIQQTVHYQNLSKRRSERSVANHVMKYIYQPVMIEQQCICLSSLNLEYYDEWKDTNIIRDLVRMLDNVLEYFYRTCPDYELNEHVSPHNENVLLDLEQWDSIRCYNVMELRGRSEST